MKSGGLGGGAAHFAGDQSAVGALPWTRISGSPSSMVGRPAEEIRRDRNCAALPDDGRWRSRCCPRISRDSASRIASSGLGIKRGGRLVEQEDGRVFQEGAQSRCAAAARQNLRSPRSPTMVAMPSGRPIDEVAARRHRRAQPRRRWRSARRTGRYPADRAVEQRNLSCAPPRSLPQALLGDLRDVLAVNRDAAVRWTS